LRISSYNPAEVRIALDGMHPVDAHPAGLVALGDRHPHPSWAARIAAT